MRTLPCLVAASCFLVAFKSNAETPASATITVELDRPGIKVSPTLNGIFFEEINRSGDGGIYAEMLVNRSFEDDRAIELNWRTVPQKPPLFLPELWEPRPGKTRPVYGWSILEGKASLDQSLPLNPNNPTSLKIDLEGKAAVCNSGFVPFRTAPGTPGIGLNIVKDATYNLSLYARSEEFSGPLIARLESKDGSAVLAQDQLEGIGKQWRQFNLQLHATTGDPAARLVLAAEGKGPLWLDMVSLFPKETWKGRKNGLRKDLMEKVEAMKPKFVRFPGGCFVEGDILKNAVRWKTTIGDVAQRPGTWTYRGYLSTDGLGMLEYLLMCEDLKAEPLLVVNCMMSHQEQKAPLTPEAKFDPADLTGIDEFVQDALDAIEYCNGPAESKWGALRAKAGHPEPFNLKWIEVGNENSRKAYELRYAVFQKAIQQKYPSMNVISNGWKGDADTPVAFVDDHFYPAPEGFLKLADHYDKANRKGPKVYVGEYAANNPGVGQGNLNAALGEAAFMIGMERNADHVIMASYAPLFTHSQWRNWNPDAIVFDQHRCFGTPSYYLQTMFAAHVPEVMLPLKLESPSTLRASGTGAVSAKVFADAGFNATTGEVILKFANCSDTPVEASINLIGSKSLGQTGTAWVLTGSPGDENSFEHPEKVLPKQETVSGIANQFKRAFPASSITVLSIPGK